MGNMKLTKDKSTSILAIVITTAAYAIERLMEMFFEPTRIMALIIAIVMTVALVAVVGLMFTNKNPFFGLLASLIGYKMLPPTVSMMGEVSLYGQEAYYLLRCGATLMFMYLIVKFYRLQQDNKAEMIRPVPILALMMSIPFFTGIVSNSYYFIMAKTGNMLYVYFTQFAMYFIGSMVILVLAKRANYNSLRFASYFVWTALGINALKKIGAIVAMAISGDHISKSYFAWIAVYAVVAIVFYIAKANMKKKNA